MVDQDVSALIERRLVAIEEEAGRLRRALSHLDPSGNGGGRRQGRRRSTAPRPAAPPAGGSHKRAAPGQRQDELVDAIQKMPGASPGELADAIGIGSTQVYGMVRSLEGKGRIVKSGQGFTVAG